MERSCYPKVLGRQKTVNVFLFIIYGCFDLFKYRHVLYIQIKEYRGLSLKFDIECCCIIYISVCI